IESFLPSKGVVQSLILTEKQYNDMHFLLGKKIKEVRNSAERTIIL
ncbi:CRISPR-associated endonuclease Cas2, partial [Lactobacillus salivarius]|nr:CRISPR-associated endonuclease Cas2 [Ligilactobacillus salivarius]